MKNRDVYKLLVLVCITHATGVHFVTIAVRDCDRLGDWVKKSLTNFQGGLEWVDGNKLCDLDYADDISLIETSQMGMQLMTEEVEKI